jgi:DNA-binding IclR family transcriptional regulator
MKSHPKPRRHLVATLTEGRLPVAAAAVVDGTGEAVAALGVRMVPAERLPCERYSAVGALVVEAAAAMSRQLGNPRHH